MADRSTDAEAVQAVLDALPVSGEITYTELRDKLIAAGNGGALNLYRSMKRSGQLTSRLVADEAGNIRHLVGRA